MQNVIICLFFLCSVCHNDKFQFQVKNLWILEFISAAVFVLFYIFLINPILTQLDVLVLVKIIFIFLMLCRSEKNINIK